MEVPCTLCQKNAHFMCARCSNPYCSTSCQLRDWENHSKTCKLTKKYIKTMENARDIYSAAKHLDDAVELKRGKVFLLNDIVYKFCDTEKEFLQNYEFFLNNQSITPKLIEADHAALVLATANTTGYMNVHRIVTDKVPFDKNVFQIALVKSLLRLNTPAYGRDLMTNVSNIGYRQDPPTVIFYENNGKIQSYDTHTDMVLAFLRELKDNRHGNLLIGRILSEEQIEKLKE